MKTTTLDSKISTGQVFRKMAVSLVLSSLVIIVFPSHVYGDNSKQNIPDAINDFAKDKKRMRIAVLDFVNTSGQKTRYDGYIADTILSELSKYPLTLLERKRLNDILNEHALSQSGIIDSEKALKMGMLLPVDVIVSGSYTMISDQWVVNGRFIHVGSGEIIHAFTAFINAEKKQATAHNDKQDCAHFWEPVESTLNDLKDKSAVNFAVDSAVSIPFEEKGCGKIHYKVMHALSKHKTYPEKYKQFIMSALLSIKDPSKDRRAKEIFRFLSSDKIVEHDEWKAMISAFKKMNAFALHIPLSKMLNNKWEEKNTVQKRIDEIMDLTKHKEIGKPVPISEVTMFFSMLSGLHIYHREDMANPIYVFKKYQKLIPDRDKYNKKAAGLMEAIYLVDHDRNMQKQALEQLIRFYNAREKTSLLATEIVDTIRSIESKIDHRYTSDKNRKMNYINDLQTINKSLADLICHSVWIAKDKGFRSQVEDRIEYILKHQIECEHAPTLKALEEDMRSGDWDKKLKAIELLSKIGIAAKPAEQTVIKYLGQQGFGRKGGRLRRLCAATLGNINTQDPKGIFQLVESFPDYDNGVSHEAKEAIKKIGVAALPYLIKGLDHQHHAVRYGCAEAIGNLGSGAKSAVKRLEELSEKDGDPYVKKQAKGAIQMIMNSF